jgi:hypothetical protein
LRAEGEQDGKPVSTLAECALPRFPRKRLRFSVMKTRQLNMLARIRTANRFPLCLNAR